MAEWEKRVLKEYAELSEKIIKLNCYIYDRDSIEAIDPLLQFQLSFMEGYRDVLQARIKGFENG